jgi:hypothetical protein
MAWGGPRNHHVKIIQKAIGSVGRVNGCASFQKGEGLEERTVSCCRRENHLLTPELES